METFAFPGREHYSQGTCAVWYQWKRLGLNYDQLFVAIFRRHERCNVLIFLHGGVYIYIHIYIYTYIYIYIYILYMYVCMRTNSVKVYFTITLQKDS